ncbi:unnamed protein product [Sympodiomycopsis kandeliae]
MTQPIHDVPLWTAPPSLAAVPPRPLLDVIARPECQPSFPPRITLREANLASAVPPRHQTPSANQTVDELRWRLEVTCSAHTDRVHWSEVMEDLVKYPERTSTNILRADVLFEENAHNDDAKSSAEWTCTKRVVRNIAPRRPGVNPEMIELCCFYKSANESENALLVTYTPLMPRAQEGEWPTFRSIDELLSLSRRPAGPEEIPFYHPAVLSLGFTFRGAIHSDSSDSKDTLEISMLPFPSNAGNPTLNRVAHTLLKVIHIHTWGKAHSYKSRVVHDRLVPRALFQDVYLNLKLRWAAFLTTQWKEKTNPEKHVHEDLAVAAWLICFWKSRFTAGSNSSIQSNLKVTLMERPWLSDPQSWGRPKGGFVDVGCGNGLLVWLLNNEGYAGHGFDLRPRKSWELFDHEGTSEVEYSSQHTDESRCNVKVTVDYQRADLRVHTLDAMAIIHDHIVTRPSEVAVCGEQTSPARSLFPGGSFFIGNHADELTPLLPFLAETISDCSGLLNIPCCPWMVSGDKFTRTNYRVSRQEVATLLGIPVELQSVEEAQIQILRTEMGELSLGPPVDATASGQKCQKPSATSMPGSKMIAYLTYISHLHLMAGWHVEKEALRMPSTKNWSIVSTRRVSNAEDNHQRQSQVQALVAQAIGNWEARDATTQGKWFLADDHFAKRGGKDDITS